jgi:hypothetical protein
VPTLSSVYIVKLKVPILEIYKFCLYFIYFLFFLFSPFSSFSNPISNLVLLKSSSHYYYIFIHIIIILNAQTKLQYDAWLFCVLVKTHSLLIRFSHMSQEVDGKSHK